MNDLNLSHILDISPTLHMHNTKPTPGVKNIDILVSDMVHYFCESIIIPNVATDIPDGQPGGGKMSDHPIIYCEPRLDSESKPAKQMVLKKTRRFNQARKEMLAKWIQHESWEQLYNSKSMADTFIQIVNSKIDEICPQEVVKVSQFDGKFNSLALQKLARRKKREYAKNGCSKKYKDIKKNMKKIIKIE